MQCRGAGEERPQSYMKYDEDVPQPGNPTVRQEPVSATGLATGQGRCCVHLVRKTQYVVVLTKTATLARLN